jgi:exopolyphosphatase/guanosine-5'-triphosphate,3'-diphosphate pyrophosphatase
VTGVALALYKQLAPDATALEVSELRWAAELHELGMMVSHHDHHRHSAYLLAHVDAAGFSQSQQRQLADLVLGQRGGLRKMEAVLDSEDMAVRLMCLRLAVIKCHARQPIDAQALTLRRRGATVQLQWPTGWAQSHPRTLHQLREEADNWSRTSALALALPEMG